MDLGAAGLTGQPFPTHGKPSAIISYGAERAAREVLENTYTDPTGLSLLQGPSLSGKSTLIRSFIDSLHEDCAVAVVDGKGLNTTKLLKSILRQFGYDLEQSSNNELLGLVRVFALQQAAKHEPPLLILDEPTVGLDLEARHRVWDVIRGMRGEGRAILLTTHHLEEAERLSSRIGIVAKGRIAAEGSMGELRTLIPAAELAVIEADDLPAVRGRAEERNLTYRDGNGVVTAWLPARAELEEVASYFRGIPLRSLSLKPVGLEEIYAEVTSLLQN